MPVKKRAKSTKTRKGSSRSRSPGRRRKSARSAKSKKSRSRAASAASEKRRVDILDPVAMENLYYIAHDAPDALELRGFRSPTPSKGNKKKKGKKKK